MKPTIVCKLTWGIMYVLRQIERGEISLDRKA